MNPRAILDDFSRQWLKPPVDEIYLKKVIGMLVPKPLGQMWIAATPIGEIMSAEIVTLDRWRADKPLCCCLT